MKKRARHELSKPYHLTNEGTEATRLRSGEPRSYERDKDKALFMATQEDQDRRFVEEYREKLAQAGELAVKNGLDDEEAQSYRRGVRQDLEKSESNLERNKEKTYVIYDLARKMFERFYKTRKGETTKVKDREWIKYTNPGILGNLKTSEEVDLSEVDFGNLPRETQEQFLTWAESALNKVGLDIVHEQLTVGVTEDYVDSVSSKMFEDHQRFIKGIDSDRPYPEDLPKFEDLSEVEIKQLRRVATYSIAEIIGSEDEAPTVLSAADMEKERKIARETLDSIISRPGFMLLYEGRSELTPSDQAKILEDAEGYIGIKGTSTFVGWEDALKKAMGYTHLQTAATIEANISRKIQIKRLFP